MPSKIDGPRYARRIPSWSGTTSSALGSTQPKVSSLSSHIRVECGMKCPGTRTLPIQVHTHGSGYACPYMSAAHAYLCRRSAANRNTSKPVKWASLSTASVKV